MAELADAGASFVVIGGYALGTPPYRIDILTMIPGVDFDEATRDGASLEIDGRRIPVIGLDALIKNKRASGRAQDIADATILGALPRAAP